MMPLRYPPHKVPTRTLCGWAFSYISGLWCNIIHILCWFFIFITEVAFDRVGEYGQANHTFLLKKAQKKYLPLASTLWYNKVSRFRV